MRYILGSPIEFPSISRADRLCERLSERHRMRMAGQDRISIALAIHSLDSRLRWEASDSAHGVGSISRFDLEGVQLRVANTESEPDDIPHQRFKIAVASPARL